MVDKEVAHTPSTGTTKEPEPKNSWALVDGECLELVKPLLLHDVEYAVLSSVLKKYVQERIEKLKY